MENRNLKVYEASAYKYKTVPAIVLKGDWVEAAGFSVGDAITVECAEGKLTITLDKSRCG